MDDPLKPRYQAVNFHFKVHFDFDSSDSSNDILFQSVTGLDSTLETETVKEGGENRFTHVVPVRRKYGPVVLKRGLLGVKQSTLTSKLKAAFENDTFQPFSLVTIHLLNDRHDTLMFWSANNVWPLSWKLGELNAMQGEVLIETLELNYNTLILNS